MRPAVKLILSLCAATIAIAALKHLGLIDLGRMATSLRESPGWLSLGVLAQLSVLAVTVLRYGRLLRVFGVNVRFTDLVTANVFSVATSQFLPGSMAVMEAVRFTLMFGAQRDNIDPAKRSAILISSVFDRLFGLLALFVMGAISGGTVLMHSVVASPLLGDARNVAMLAVVSCSVAGVVAVCILPFAARLPRMRRWVAGLRQAADCQMTGCTAGPRRTLWSAPAFVMAEVERMLELISLERRSIRSLALPFALSFLVSIMASVSFFSFVAALNARVGFAAILASFPIITLATLLPMGVAGVGGNQLVTASVFAVFGVDAALASTGSLLQTAIMFLVSTALGLLCLPRAYTQLRGLKTHVGSDKPAISSSSVAANEPGVG